MQKALTDPTALAEICLAYLAEEPRQLAEFMAAAGYDAARLRGDRHSPTLARGLIDYFAANEPLLLALCANQGIKPENFMRVWARLNPTG